MPLSAPTPRKMLHLRDIQLRAYEREDGLVEVEAHMTDAKTYTAGPFTAGAPIHDMWLRMTLTRDLVIQACEAAMDSTPHSVCPGAAPNMQRLAGLKIGRGFLSQAAQRIGGGEGCTHLRELLQPVATVAFQTIGYYADPKIPPARQALDSGLKNSCHAYREDGPLLAGYLSEPSE